MQDVRDFLAELAGVRARGVRRPPLLLPRRRRRRAPVRGGRRARLGRSSARARSSARCARLGGGRARGHRRPSLLNLLVPPRGRGRQAGPHRDRHRPRHRCRCRRPRWPWPPSGSARSTSAGCWCSAPARWARAWPSRWPAPASPRSCVANRTCGAGRASSPPASAGGPSASPTSPEALVEVDLLLTSTGAPTRHARARRRRAGDGAPRRAAAAHRRHRRAPRRRPGGRRAARRDPARHGRPAGLRRAPAWPSAAGEVGRASRASSPRSSSAPRRAAPPARSHRWSRPCATGRGRPLGRARPVPRQARELDDRQRRGGRGPDPGHRRQAAARADRRAEGRGRHAAGRASAPTRCATCSTSSSADDRARRRGPAAHRHARQRAGPLAGRARGRPAAVGGPTSSVEVVVVETTGDQRATTSRSGRWAARACS